MKIKLLRDTGIAGKPCKAGKVCNVSEKDGKYLIARGRAVESGGKAAEAKAKAAAGSDDGSGSKDDNE